MIQLRSATKQFHSRNGHPVVALRTVDLRIRPGEFVMVTGPSGSGKSTLLFMMGGMQRPTEGSVILNETDIYGLPPRARAHLRRTRIGFIFQTFNLIPYLNCLENVILPAVLAGRPPLPSEQRARQLLEHLGLGERLLHRPSELSVGERQRVALCRSLVNGPDLILADEPTGNLDGGLTEEVMQILHNLNGAGQTIVMVTHDLNLAEEGTRVVALQDGLVVDDRPSRAMELVA